ncbi:MAG: TIGR00269 family protein [Pyrodictiaceae archaeon]
MLLAVSGGKDSFTLLDVLSELHNTNRLIALSINEGIKNSTRSEEIELIRKVAKERGVDHLVVTFQEYFGLSLDEIMARSMERKLGIKACTFCGVFKRRIIDDIAKSIGADRVVTAHNLDDEAQSILMNILRGDIIGLIKTHPISSTATKYFVPRIKPLRKIYEWEAATYAIKSGYRVRSRDCPYLHLMPTLRLSLRLSLYELEYQRPGTLLKMIEYMDTLLEPLAKREAERENKLGKCTRCGYPTSPGRVLCKVCELLEHVGLTTPPKGLNLNILSTRVQRLHRQ